MKSEEVCNWNKQVSNNELGDSNKIRSLDVGDENNNKIDNSVLESDEIVDYEVEIEE